MKTFLLFILTFNAQDGALLDAHSVDDVPMTAAECLQSQQGRVSRTQDGKFQIWECRNTRYAAELTPVAATQEPTIVPGVATWMLSVIQLKYCGELIGFQIQSMLDGGPPLLTLLVEQLGPVELAAQLTAIEDLKMRGGSVYSVELRPGCTKV